MSWSRLALPPAPDGRSSSSMVYAPEFDQLILFGGHVEHFYWSNDVWVLKASAPEAGWRTFRFAEAPTPRHGSAVVWDPVGHRLVVFGGIDNATDDARPWGLNDLWALEFDATGEPTGWTVLNPGTQKGSSGSGASAQAPPHRFYSSAVYDSQEKRMIVYGGTDGTSEVAVNDPDDWAPFQVPGRMMRSDVWAFDLAGDSGWTPLRSVLGPSRYVHQAIYDPPRHQMVVTGGEGLTRAQHRTVWGYDLDNEKWTRWDPAGEPPGHITGPAAYSPELDAMVVLGGRDSPTGHRGDIPPQPPSGIRLGDEGSGAEWLALPGPVFPKVDSGRFYAAALVPGLSGERFFAFAGGGSPDNAEGWTFLPLTASYDVATGRWTRILHGLGTLRAAILNPEVALDHVNNDLYVWGGGRETGDSSWIPLWRLDLDNDLWQRMPGVPRTDHPTQSWTVFDPLNHRLVVATECLNELHAFDIATQRWAVLDPLGDAPELCDAEAVYDPARGRVIVFQGDLAFALHLPTRQDPVWHELATAGRFQSGRADFEEVYAAFDPIADRVLALSTASGAPTILQELSFKDEPEGAWRRLAISGDLPETQNGNLVFDEASNRLVFWGGSSMAAEFVPGAPQAQSPQVRTLDLDSDELVWEASDPANDPLPRRRAGAAYDPIGGRMLIFGGTTSAANRQTQGYDTREVWALDLGGPVAPRGVIDDTPPPPTVTAPTSLSATWDSLGPSGASSHDVTIGEDGTVYAASFTSRTFLELPWGYGITRSGDAGTTWTGASGAISGHHVFQIAHAPGLPSKLYSTAFTEERTPRLTRPSTVFTSEDGGANWSPAGRSLPKHTYYPIVVHPELPDVAWTSSPSGIYRTIDGGATWSETVRFDDLILHALAVTTRPAGIRLIAAGRGKIPFGVVYSDDGGFTWTDAESPQNGSGPSGVATVAVDPSDPARVVVGGTGGSDPAVWVSEDHGSSFTRVASDLGGGPRAAPAEIVLDPSSEGRTLYAATGFDQAMRGFYCSHFYLGISESAGLGVFRSVDGGSTWSRIWDLPGDEMFCGLAVSADGQQVFAASRTSGVWRSLDGGETWSPAMEAFTQTDLRSVAADPTDPDVLVAVDLQGAIRRTDDGGRTWERVGSGAESVIAHPSRPGQFLAMGRGRILRSRDGGRTWLVAATEFRWRDFPNFNHFLFGFGGDFGPGPLAFHPDKPSSWYFPIWDDLDGDQQVDDGAIGFTQNDGRSYQTLIVSDSQSGRRANCPGKVAVARSDPSRLYVGDICGAGVYRSEDSGDTWTHVSGGFKDGLVTAVEVDPLDPARVWVATSQTGVYRSDNGGDTWARVRDGLGYRPVSSFAISEADPANVLAAVPGFGVVVSSDGQSWSRIQDGARPWSPIDVTFRADDAVLAATINDGVVELAGSGSPISSPPPDDTIARGDYPVSTSDNFFAAQWALTKMRVPEAWQEPNATGFGIRVAVVDTGIDLDHEDLDCPGKVDVRPDSNVHQGGGAPEDDHGEGTFVAGLIGACTDNGVGIAGVAPDATVVPFRVMGKYGGSAIGDPKKQGRSAPVGIRRAVDAGAHVIYVGSPVARTDSLDLSALSSAVEYATSEGALVVVPAGDDGLGCRQLEDSVCVGATDRRDEKAGYSSVARKVQGLGLVAPGGGDAGLVFCNATEETIISLYPPERDWCPEGEGYLDYVGTHAAAAHVAGVAALVYDAAGGGRSPETRQRVLAALEDGAIDLGVPGVDPVFGAGRVDALRATKSVVGTSRSTPHRFIGEGFINYPNPGSFYGPGGITEIDFVTKCAIPDSQGLDGYVYELPEDFAQASAIARLSGSSDVGMPWDLDMSFYSEECERLKVVATDDPVEISELPDGTRYIVANLFHGMKTLSELEVVRKPAVASPQPSELPTLPPGSGPRRSYPIRPDDLHFGAQWGPDVIDAPEAWQVQRTTGSNIRVAVIDSGVDLQHEDLQCAGKLATGAAVINGQVSLGGAADDIAGHGSHVAGIIGACTNNGLGIAGTAPDSVIVPYRVFGDEGGTFDDVALAIRLAADRGAHVINLSLGPQIGPVSYVPGLFADVEEAVSYALSKGVVIAAAAGNDSMPLCEHPAIAEGVICVGATDRRDVKAWYSTFPNKPDFGPAVVAPGGIGSPFCNLTEDVISLFPKELDQCAGSGYVFMSGTSMAAPHVAGIAALVYDRLGGVRSTANADKVIDAIVDSAKDLGSPGYDPVFGYGRVDALAAVQEIPVTSTSPSPSATTEPTADPTSEPTADPTSEPTGDPTSQPTEDPTSDPTSEPTEDPTSEPSGDPSEQPSEEPTSPPTQSPTGPQDSSLAFTDRSEEGGQYSDDVFLEARLTDGDGNPLRGEELTFELLGPDGTRTFRASTDARGVAGKTIRLQEAPGAHQLTVRFAGDDDRQAAVDTTLFVVDKEDSDTALSLSRQDGDRRLTARLSDKDDPTVGIAKRTIRFFADAEEIGSTSTANDGTASLKAPAGYSRGQHDFTAAFAGDDYYLKSSKKANSDGSDDPPGGGSGGGGGGSGGGSGSQPSPTPTQSSPTPAESPVTGSASTTIASDRSVTRYRQGFTLAGELSASGACAGVERVEILRRNHGSDAYDPIGSAPTRTDGTWSLDLAARHNASYIARPSTRTGCEAQSSVPTDVLVKARVDIDPVRGCKARQVLTGAVLPDHPGTDVLLQKRKNGRWVTRAAAPLDEGSGFRLKIPTCVGSFRVLWPRQDETNLRGVRRIRL